MRVDGCLLDDLRQRDWLTRSQRRLVKQVDAAEQLGHLDGSAIAEAATVLGVPEADVRAAAAAGANKPAALAAPTIVGEAHELPDQSANVEGELVAKEILGHAVAVLKGMSAVQRLVVVLVRYYDLAIEEAAKVVDLDLEDAKAQYQSAVLDVHQAMLRAALTGG
jgi:DNA-directed RNA polymerase specialized sigma subunit